MGNDVRVAYDGEAALAAVADFRPTAVLLDLGMPRMNGYDVAGVFATSRAAGRCSSSR